VQFHFTPTSASWLNQVEVWFSILQGQSLSGASFTSLKQLELHIDAYIKAYNDKAEPFVWTKKNVRQRRFKGRRITRGHHVLAWSEKKTGQLKLQAANSAASLQFVSPRAKKADGSRDIETA
jgi:hypothetical protein